MQNYYAEDAAMVEIPLEPGLTPVQNAQKYYKEYRKAATAEKLLIGLIKQEEYENEGMDVIDVNEEDDNRN